MECKWNGHGKAMKCSHPQSIKTASSRQLNSQSPMAYPGLQVDYNQPVSAAEKAEIDAVCLKFRDNTQVLRDTRCNQVQVYRGGTWWHTTTDDPKEHVTVRYNRYSARRCHVYRDGSGTIRPPCLTAEQRAANDDPDNSDWSAEFSDREDDEEVEEEKEEGGMVKAEDT